MKTVGTRDQAEVQGQELDLAMTICLTLGVLYGSPLRQNRGLMRSIAKLMGVVMSIPDFSTLPRRAKG
jgi:hypothetical protein